MPDIVLVQPGETAPMDPTAPGFAHGFGLFETMRYTGGWLHFWGDHWARLARSAAQFGLALPTESEVLDVLRELASRLQGGHATLKLSLVKSVDGSRLYVYARDPLPAAESRRLILDTSYPICPRSLLAGHKTHNYMESMHLLGEARSSGFMDMLRVDAEGFLAETTTANFFFVQGGRCHTPSLDTGILPGVSRAALLRAPGLRIEEGRYRPETLRRADAAFVTNATHGLLSVEMIEGFADGEAVDFGAPADAIAPIQTAYGRIDAESAYQLI